jgi:hypothetical protein
MRVCSLEELAAQIDQAWNYWTNSPIPGRRGYVKKTPCFPIFPAVSH